MYCPKADKLSQFVDDVLTDKEYKDVAAHVKTCTSCQAVIELFQGEQQFIIETLQAPTLPDDFADNVLTQLDEYQPVVKMKQTKKLKHVLIFAAGIVLAIGITSSISPSFAQFIGGLFTTEDVDKGLQMANEMGIGERIDLQVTDQGLTLKVEDIVVDSSRIALSYQVLNNKGIAQDTYLALPDILNVVKVINENGNELEDLNMGWTNGNDYGLIEFSLRKLDVHENLTIHFDIKELNGVKGNWLLDVPVNTNDHNSLTTKIALNEQTTVQGVQIRLNKLELAPSSSDLYYETLYTDGERQKIEREIRLLEEKFGQEFFDMFKIYGADLAYHIKSGQEKLYESYYFQGSVLSSNFLEGTGRPIGELGHIAKTDAFIPQQQVTDLTFVLDGLIKTVPADFAITIKPKQLEKHPVSFDYEGNYYTFTAANKEKDTIQIDMKGSREAQAANLLKWVVVDSNGQVHDVNYSGATFDEQDENGRYLSEMSFTTYDINKLPEELTLHLIAVTRFEEIDEKWEVPLN
ncbi:DUF4179 domain-containing protein [Solibacillus sp. CAU 1738]|uniref:DUF4179 domain-containing protein n=1 Tax=Solibacillus sp. CAU 1738 TaxID=3140363 RepID=UPI003261CF0E